MAAAPGTSTDLVKITINDVELDVPKGELIVESVKRVGLEIPIFCYHPRMKPVGMCRMCLVEVGFKQPDGSVRKMPKPQAGCTLPASDGMVVYTDSALVHKDRKGVLEFLLVNHPLDCPICDRGGECPLQNNTLFYGPSTSRFIEVKRHLPKAFPLSRYVTLDLERCIQCGRCVRFTEEISGDGQLAFRFRGAQMQPSTFKLTDFESKFSGNVIEICPVGALTSANYRFRARPWDLETSPAVCTVCSNGCNVWFDHRVGRFVRINGRTNEAVNEEWTCDRGKFGHEFYNDAKRLKTPLIRKKGAFVACTWAEAYDAILKAFKPGGNQVAALARASFSNEGLFMLQRLLREGFGSNNLDHRWTRALVPAGDRLDKKMGIPQVATPIAALEGKSAILAFGGSLADDLPIVFLRVRKAWFKHGAKVVAASDRATEVDGFAALSLRYRQNTEATLAAGLLAEAVAQGKAQVPEPVRKDLSKFPADKVAAETGVAAEALREAVAQMGPGAAIICSEALLNVPEAQSAVEYLAGLAMATGAELNLYPTGTNDFGAAELGVLPDAGPGGKALEGEPGLGTHGVLSACAEGSVRALWLADADPLRDHFDRELAERALEGVDFLVVQTSVESEAMAYASVVLPLAAPAEQDGSYTNCEGRVQRMAQIVTAPGEAKAAWRAYAEALVRIKPGVPFFNAGEVMEAIGTEAPPYAEAGYSNLEGEGVLLGPARAPQPA